MQHIIATRDRLRPAGIGFEVGGEKRKPIDRRRATLVQHRQHVLASIRMAYGRAYMMTRGEQLQDGMHRHETGSARHQNGAHLVGLSPAVQSLHRSYAAQRASTRKTYTNLTTARIFRLESSVR